MDKQQIETLHKKLLTAWNARDAKAMASFCTEDANFVGFDGSQMDGFAQIQTELEKVFESHKTSTYIWKVREVRFLNDKTALLRAVVGMIPPGKNDIKPDVNAVQTMVAVLQSGEWRISLFQNTPAKFDGRPELAKKLTDELRKLL